MAQRHETGQEGVWVMLGFPSSPFLLPSLTLYSPLTPAPSSTPQPHPFSLFSHYSTPTLEP
jgi:hypothetical protein